MNKSTRKLQCAAKAASLALKVAVTREHNRPAKDATAEAVRHAVRGGHYLARDNKGHYVISQVAADALNEVIDKGNLTERDQITLWRVHQASKVSKAGEIQSPRGYAAQLCGFVWGGTHYGARLQYKAQHKAAVKKEPKPILAGDPRSVACPKCNAKAGSICVRDNGKPQHNTHAARKTGAAGMPVVAGMDNKRTESATTKRRLIRRKR